MANTETIIVAALRIAAEQYDNDSKSGGAGWSMRLKNQFEQQARDARAIADFIEERGMDALEDGPVGLNTLPEVRS